MIPYGTLRHGLVGAWCPSLTPGATLIPDVSNGRANATIVNNPSLSGLWSEGALSIGRSGGQTYGVIAPSPVATFGASATFSMWVRLALATPADAVLGGIATMDNGGTDQSFYPFSDGVAYIGWFRTARVNSITLNSTVTRTRWHNICVTTNGVRWKFFQSGILVSDVAAESTVKFTSSLFRIGESTRPSSSSFFLNGLWDDARLWNRALSDSEVKILATSRRIGLLPARHRRGNASGSALWLRQSGEWKRATTWINVGGTWKTATPKLNVSGTWK